MRLYKTFMAIAVSTAAYAQTYTIAGTVTNVKDEPVANAIVSLIGHNATSVTNAKGQYSLIGWRTGTVVKQPAPAGNIEIRNGVIYLSGTEIISSVSLMDLREDWSGKSVTSF